MSFFQSSTVQVEDASFTKISFKKKKGVPDTVPEKYRWKRRVHFYVKCHKGVSTEVVRLKGTLI